MGKAEPFCPGWSFLWRLRHSRHCRKSANPIRSIVFVDAFMPEGGALPQLRIPRVLDGIRAARQRNEITLLPPLISVEMRKTVCGWTHCSHHNQSQPIQAISQLAERASGLPKRHISALRDIANPFRIRPMSLCDEIRQGTHSTSIVVTTSWLTCPSMYYGRVVDI